MFSKCISLIAATLMLSTGLAGAEEPAIKVPIVGYSVRQSPPELRPILGVPGAAVIGNQVKLPPRSTHLHVAPGQQYAILQRFGEDPAVLMIEGTVRGTTISIPGVMTAPEAVWFSPSGNSAALASRSTGELQILRGLPSVPEVVRNIDVRALQDYPTAVGVSDSGSSILYAAAGAVYSLQADGSSRIVFSQAGDVEIAFLPASDVAAIGDSGSGLVSMYSGSRGGVSALAGGLMGLHHLAASRDGRLLFVDDQNAPCIWVINVSSGIVSESELPVIPDRLDALRNADMFLISSKPGEPNWIVFRRADAVTVVFVPAPTRNTRLPSR